MKNFENILKAIKYNIKLFYRKLKKVLSSIKWFLIGFFIKNPPLPNKIESICYICMGNICRSPFAEMYTKAILHSNSFSLNYITSSGLDVTKSLKPPINAMKSAENYHLDLSKHLSKPLSQSALVESDIFIAMEYDHILLLRKDKRILKNKVFLLPLFDRYYNRHISYYEKFNIQDPYNGSVDDFDYCYSRIANCIDQIFAEIKK